jgi:cytochrome P450
MTAVESKTAEAALFALLITPEGRADPYPHYQAIRQEAPVLLTSLGTLALSGYHDSLNALRNPRLGRGSRQRRRTGFMAGTLDPEIEKEFLSRGANSMLMADPPDHTRLRKLANRAFTPRRVAELRSSIQAMVDTIVDSMVEAGTSDIMSELAFPLPVAVIGELLGVPEADRAGFQPLIQRLTVGIEPFADNESMRGALDAQDEARGYFAELLADRRRTPRDDMLSALAHARESDDQLTDDEVIATAILLFAAGFETTTNLIGNGVLALLQHPAEFDRLRADPAALAQSATEELLRWDSPVQVNARVALEPAEVAGNPVEPGQMILVLQGAANRDPDRFDHAGTLDIGREDNGPISFGGGAHHCLGAPLARMEGEVVFASLARRFAHIEQAADQLQWKPGITLRGLASLPVTLQPV